MSVWDEIDQMLAQYRATLARTKERCRELGGSAVRADELGFWRCSYRPTSGDRRVVRLVARSPDELVRALEKRAKVVRLQPKGRAA